MIARLTSRTPLPIDPNPVPTISDTVPSGTPFVAGSPDPTRPRLPEGTYTLRGKVFGSATVTITDNADHSAYGSVAASYTNFSDDGIQIINGTESVSGSPIVWHENLLLSGCETGTKITSEPGGFTITTGTPGTVGFNATGTLTTTIDGVTYTQPANGT